MRQLIMHWQLSN